MTQLGALLSLRQAAAASSVVRARRGDRYFVDVEHAALKRFYPPRAGQRRRRCEAEAADMLAFLPYHHILF